jgi:hypothetical protein
MQAQSEGTAAIQGISVILQRLVAVSDVLERSSMTVDSLSSRKLFPEMSLLDPVDELRRCCGAILQHAQTLTTSWLKLQDVIRTLKEKEKEKPPHTPQPPPSLGSKRSPILESEIFQSVLAGEEKWTLPKGERHQSLPTGPTCVGCSSSHCIHREALADHVIDRTFDEHKTLLRERMQKAEEELKKFKSGELYLGYQRTIATLSDEKKELEKALRKASDDLISAKCEAFEAKRRPTESEASATTSGSSSGLLRNRGVNADKFELAAVSRQRQREITTIAGHLNYFHALTEAMFCGFDCKMVTALSLILPPTPRLERLPSNRTSQLGTITVDRDPAAVRYISGGEGGAGSLRKGLSNTRMDFRRNLLTEEDCAEGSTPPVSRAPTKPAVPY